MRTFAVLIGLMMGLLAGALLATAEALR